MGEASVVGQMAKLKALPKEFTATSCGGNEPNGGTKARITARKDCLERLRLRAPDLSPRVAVIWPRFVKWYSVWVGKQHKGHGAKFIKEVNEVIEKLGGHFKPGLTEASKASSSGGNPKALEAWVLHLWKRSPKPVAGQTLTL